MSTLVASAMDTPRSVPTEIVTDLTNVFVKGTLVVHNARNVVQLSTNRSGNQAH